MTAEPATANPARPSALQRLAAGTRQSLRTGPLADRNFRFLVSGQTTSTVGDFCYAVALPWMVLSARGGGVAVLGLVLACYGIPRTVLIPVGGILADRLSPRVVMLGADMIRCLLACSLIYLDAQHTISLATLGPVAALVGACGGLFIPASYSLLPHLLPAEQLQAGNAISSAGNQLGGFAGPALAGALVTVFSPAAAFGVDAATFAVSAVTLVLIRSPQPVVSGAIDQDAAASADPDRGKPQQADGDSNPTMPPLVSPNDASPTEASPADTSPAPNGGRGLRQLVREPVLYNLMLVALTANLVLTGTFEVAMPDLAHAHFGAGGYGAMLACFGAGAVVGSLAAARGGSLRAPAITACRVFIASSVAVALVPYLGGLPGACAAILVLAVCTSFGDIIVITLLQQWAPPGQLGRVMSMIMLASMGSFPLSVAVSGFLVDKLGPQPFFPAGAIVMALAVIYALSRQEIRTLGTKATSLEHAQLADAA